MGEAYKRIQEGCKRVKETWKVWVQRESVGAEEKRGYRGKVGVQRKNMGTEGKCWYRGKIWV